MLCVPNLRSYGSIIEDKNEIDIGQSEKICKVYKGSDIHYISWIFGIVLSCLYISMITIIPLHNTLREPEYFWEFMLYMSFGFCSIFAAHIVLATFFVANVNPGNNLLAFLVMTLVGAIINIVTTVFYYIIWVYVLGFFAPMPMALYIPGSITVIGCIGLSWFRYNSNNILCIFNVNIFARLYLQVSQN